MSPEVFFEFARKRHQIYINRQAELPRPWTDDPILQHYRFTNVFRELDKTTIWLREHVRDRMRDSPDVFAAVAVYRWFNRITTGEALFSQENVGLGGELPGETAFEAFVRMCREGAIEDAVGCLRAAMLSYLPERGPYVTGAYIIKTPDGMDKMEGVLQAIQWLMADERPGPHGMMGWMQAVDSMVRQRWTLQQAWAWLREFRYMGDFMAYEVVSDLRWTRLLDRAADIMTWANPGPGAMRGLGRLHNWTRSQSDMPPRIDRGQMIREMQHLLSISRSPNVWPADWPTWEMRDVEHSLCEFDKYQRVLMGEGRPRGVFS